MGKDDNSKKLSSRIDNIVGSFADTGEKAITKCGNELISINVPKAMNKIVEMIKELCSSVTNKTNKSMGSNIRNIIFQGIEIGETNKEQAIVLAMRELGFEDHRINQVLERATKYLITRECVESTDK